MYFGYNTNGFAHHSPKDAMAVISELGYDGVAITIDHHLLNPFHEEGLDERAFRMNTFLENHGIDHTVIETGARYLLDPGRKHQPTLISPTEEEQDLRFTLLMFAVRLAGFLGSDCVSFWSGAAADDAPPTVLMDRLVDGCKKLCQVAEQDNERLAFEPEPGMFIDTMAKYERLFEAVDHPLFGLTLDVGHLQCMGELPIAPHILKWKDVLWYVHIEDMKKGRHEHLMFGEGDLDFKEVFSALRQIDYRGGIYVELSRHSHMAVETARKALAFLEAQRGDSRV
jgi:sugar phosphate isomerase/epimerase